MKIGYFADGPWSHLALEKIAAEPRIQVAFIVPRFDTQDPVLKTWAERLGVPFLPLQDVNTTQSLRLLESFGADLFVSMSFNQILKAEIISLPKLGIVNCHAGALPFYRGRNILNWALINDAKEFGVTVHYIDTGIDTGDIILSRNEPITDADTYRTLLDRAVVTCADLLHRALMQIESGSARRTKQSEIDRVGFYVGRRQPGDEWIDWNWSSRRIFNFIRAIGAPGPGAITTLDGHQIVIGASEQIEGAPTYIGIPGEIVGFSQGNAVVKTGDSTLKLTQVAASPQVRMRIGKRFVSGVGAEMELLRKRIAELERQMAASTLATKVSNRE